MCLTLPTNTKNALEFPALLKTTKEGFSKRPDVIKGYKTYFVYDQDLKDFKTSLRLRARFRSSHIDVTRNSVQESDRASELGTIYKTRLSQDEIRNSVVNHGVHIYLNLAGAEHDVSAGRWRLFKGKKLVVCEIEGHVDDFVAKDATPSEAVFNKIKIKKIVAVYDEKNPKPLPLSRIKTITNRFK